MTQLRFQPRHMTGSSLPSVLAAVIFMGLMLPLLQSQLGVERLSNPSDVVGGNAAVPVQLQYDLGQYLVRNENLFYFFEGDVAVREDGAEMSQEDWLLLKQFGQKAANFGISPHAYYLCSEHVCYRVSNLSENLLAAIPDPQ